MLATAPVIQPAEIHKLFQDAINYANATGSFERVEDILISATDSLRRSFLRELPAIMTARGPGHDIPSKLRILEDYGEFPTGAQGLRSAILEAEGFQRYDELAASGILDELSAGDFSSVCTGIADSDLSYAFEAAANAARPDVKKAAAAAVARKGISHGVLGASEEIGRLPAGAVRDEAILELVRYLRSAGSPTEATEWFGAIGGLDARSRAVGQ